SIFVDGLPPVPTLIELVQRVDESQDLFWSAFDNFSLDQTKTALIACSTKIVSFLPKTSEELKTLPADCQIVLEGEELHKAGSEINAKPKDAIAGVKYEYLLYAEDEVGFGASTWMAKSGSGA